MNVIWIILIVLLFLNTLAAIVTVFRKPRSITSILAWLLTLTFLPGLGFLIYVFFGRGIDGETMYKFTHEDKKKIGEIEQLVYADNQKVERQPSAKLYAESEALKHYFANLDESPLSKRNSIRFYTDGKQKFQELFADLKEAKSTIHVEYYSFFNDDIGNQFLRILEEKVQEGVKVRLIFDPWGSPGANKKFFAHFVALGGKVTPFITSRDLIRKTRLNYHLHRKIVVIDGKIGWTGGFNVGDQYLGKKEKFGYWRDTHARIVGTASFSLQEIFIKDWNASVRKKQDLLTYHPDYFVCPEDYEVSAMNLQVVSDGPESEEHILKGGCVKMMFSAEKSIWIQTPYLVPDDTVIHALLTAVRCGVDVRIMIPCMPDHPFIYRVTQYYANYLHQRGVKIYIYQQGFLHAKTMVVDNQLATFGSMNHDIRSYALNFEINTFAYDRGIAEEFRDIFLEDMKMCQLLTDEMIAGQSRWLRFKQNFSRLFSPIL